MGVSGIPLIQNTVARLAGIDLKAGGAHIGKRFMRNASRLGSREVRSAMLAHAAVGAIGGAAYGQATSRDWKGGAMRGAIGGAGMWSIGGMRGLRNAGISSGLLKRNERNIMAKKGEAAAERVVRAGTRVGPSQNMNPLGPSQNMQPPTFRDLVGRSSAPRTSQSQMSDFQKATPAARLSNDLRQRGDAARKVLENQHRGNVAKADDERITNLYKRLTNR